ncbi:MAG: hypothetical protein JWO87_3041 [Phycisphaerales bacterium]|jgi:hypothetical protein|nr:hypothetical protein [Phycisphaerales bacterium]MDB5301378.1 hypothetical protein [Phycisphaerales bacterium]
MRKMIYAAVLGCSMLSVPMLTGCDNTTAEKEVKTKQPDGTTTVDKAKTTTDDNGSTKTTTEHKVDRP